MLQETLELQPSERAVFQVAGNLLSGYVAKNGCPPDEENQAIVDWAVNTSIYMAKKIDKLVVSDDELG